MKSLLIVILAIVSNVFAQQEDIQVIKAICETVPEDYFVRNISDCAGWIKCSKSGPVSGLCPSPYVFDETRQFCTYKENVKCPPEECPKAGFSFLPVANSCARYVLCLFGIPIEQICGDGLQYNPEKKTCDLKSNVRCREPCPTNLSNGKFKAERDSFNCSTGYVCFGAVEPAKVECSPPLHFDETTLMCVRPRNGTEECTQQVALIEAAAEAQPVTATRENVPNALSEDLGLSGFNVV